LLNRNRPIVACKQNISKPGTGHTYSEQPLLYNNSFYCVSDVKIEHVTVNINKVVFQVKLANGKVIIKATTFNDHQ